MVSEVIVPRTDWSTGEATVLRWLKKEEEHVEKDQIICEVETEKAVVEIGAPASGALRRIMAPEGTAVPVGGLIALIAEPGEELGPYAGAEVRIEEKTPLTSNKKIRGSPPAASEKKAKVSPLAKKVAEAYGVDISKIQPTRADGRITRKDVLSYAQTVVATIPAQEDEIIPLTGWRKMMAQRMSESMRSAAHVTTMAEVDATEMMNLRSSLEAKFATRITYTAFLVKAIAEALKEYPTLNASLTGEQIVVKKKYHIGLAIAREEGGLVVPVIRDADNRSLLQIAETIEQLRKKAAENRFSPEELTGATFTLTNPGVLGVIMDTPIINPPNSAILSACKIVQRAVVIDNRMCVRPMMYLCLTYDHRIVDGLPAVKFLQRLKGILEAPAALV